MIKQTKYKNKTQTGKPRARNLRFRATSLRDSPYAGHHSASYFVRVISLALLSHQGNELLLLLIRNNRSPLVAKHTRFFRKKVTSWTCIVERLTNCVTHVNIFTIITSSSFTVSPVFIASCLQHVTGGVTRHL